MIIRNAIRTAAPALAMAAAAALGGCNASGDISFNGQEGVPLEELDMSGAAPTELALLGPDNIVLTEGSALAITVEGADTDQLRFVLDGNSLGIMREGNYSGSGATVNIIMPAPAEISVAGSGSISAEKLASKAGVNIAGSGSLDVADVDADELEVVVAGSGRTRMAAGSVRKLELSILGSGKADLAGVRTDDAEVNIAGSGDSALASDGQVEVNIMGSGDVTVTGNAQCKVSSMGSGTVTCDKVVKEDA